MRQTSKEQSMQISKRNHRTLLTMAVALVAAVAAAGPASAAPDTSARGYIDDALGTGMRGLATKSGGEVISDFAVDHPISSKEESA
jgi:hypothetical protein